MKTKIFSALVIFSIIFTVSAKPESKISERSLYQFVAGIMLLKNSGNLNDSVKVEYYRDLVEITGVDKKYVTELLKNRYYNNPEKWENVYEKALKYIKNSDRKE